MTDHVPSLDAGLWVVACDDFDAVSGRLDSTDDELEAAGDAKAIIANRIRSTPAITFEDVIPKFAILKDCYVSIADLAEAVTGRSCDYTRLAGDMALSICSDLLTLIAAPHGGVRETQPLVGWDWEPPITFNVRVEPL